MPKKEGKSTSHLGQLIESNIALEHKIADLLLGIKDLNENVSSLVHIFKSAAEHIKSEKYEDPMESKLNDLLEQNRRLQQALLLLEKYVKERPPQFQPSSGVR